MIPPPPSEKPVAFYDTECFPNYWLLKFRVRGGLVYTFELHEDESLPQASIATILQLFDLFTVVSFNGIYYDVPMLTAALNGYTTEQLKYLNDQIIPSKEDLEAGRQGLKPWELGLPEWAPSDHIDIMETLPGKGSLKEYAARVHYHWIKDLPYGPHESLTPSQQAEVAEYCENDTYAVEFLYDMLAPQIAIRTDMGGRYGLDLRSKSDAQCAEAILKRRCEQVLGRRIYKPEIDWGLAFRYEPPAFLAFSTPQMQAAFEQVKAAVFTLSATGTVVMPPQLEGLAIGIGSSVYRMGIGGLHSSEQSRVVRSTDTHVLKDADVASYYPNLMINSGKYPPALGPTFTVELDGLKASRLVDKRLQKKLEKDGLEGTHEWVIAYNGNEGKKVFVNGTFGKTLSNYSVLFAPQMGIQTTVTGQLSLLMLVEWMEHYGIPVVSANTDGIVCNCPLPLVETCEALIKEWERRTGLEMDWPLGEYDAIYSRDVNAYFAVKSNGDVKRKGTYSEAGLVSKKSPDVEICSDAVEAFLAKGTPLIYTLWACRDIRKFLKVRKVAGGGIKLWGEGPRKDMKVRDMTGVLEAAGWVKSGRKWARGAEILSAGEAYKKCFAPQRREFIGKVIRWFYGTNSPGQIIYSNGNQVSLSYGAQPCMVIPEEMPADVDYAWYLQNCNDILKEIGYSSAPIGAPDGSAAPSERIDVNLFSHQMKA